MHSCIICRATFDCQSKVKLKFVWFVCIMRHPYSATLSYMPKTNIMGWVHKAIVSAAVCTVQAAIAATITSACLFLLPLASTSKNNRRWFGWSVPIVWIGQDRCSQNAVCQCANFVNELLLGLSQSAASSFMLGCSIPVADTQST